MKIKTSELTGPALRWAVAEAEWKGGVSVGCLIGQQIYCYDDGEKVLYEPDTNWAQGGLIIEQEAISVTASYAEYWSARILLNLDEHDEATVSFGPTPLIAAMRCYVASKLGDEVDVPKELT